MTRSGGNTYITITLHNGFRWANVKENLKIQPFAKAPTSYVQPGAFKYKFSVSPHSTVTYKASLCSASIRASASISTRISDAIRRLTSTMLVAGLISPKNSP